MLSGNWDSRFLVEITDHLMMEEQLASETSRGFLNKDETKCPQYASVCKKFMFSRFNRQS
jgi:hypothetical protein